MRRYGSDLVPVVGTERRSGAAGGAGVRGGARYRLQPFRVVAVRAARRGAGIAFGLACGLIGSVLMPRPGKSLADAPIPGHQKALYGLGVAFATYSATVLPPRGNGFIAVFVAAVVIGVRRPDLRHYFAEGVGEIAEIVKLGVFAVFGSLLTLHALGSNGWGAIAVVAGTFLLARPVAIWIALAGTGMSAAAKSFMAWFGPKGVATMAYSILILDKQISSAPRIF